MRFILSLLFLFHFSQSFAEVTVSVNGTDYTIPETGEQGWGDNVTQWIQAISANTVQPSGGSFVLTSDLDFGSTNGLIAKYYKEKASNISSVGVLRLSNTGAVGWRNGANSADLLLDISGDALEFNGVLLADISTAQTLTNKTIDADLNTITNIENADIKSGANIAHNKMAALTASRALESDGSGVVSASTVTSTELGYLSGVTASVQTQVDSKVDVSGDVMSGDLAFQNAYGIQSNVSDSGSLNIGTTQTNLGLNLGSATTIISLSGDTFADNINVLSGGSASFLDEADIKFFDDSSTNYIAFKAPASVSSNKTFIWAEDGLAGQVLTTDGAGTLSFQSAGSVVNVVTKTTTYTATTADDVILADATSGAFTITLYAASGNAGKQIRIKKTSSGFNAITVDGNSTETIDGALTQLVYLQYDEITLLCNGTGWSIINKYLVPVYAEYNRGSTQTLTGGANTLRDYSTLVSESHAGMTTTGASWNFTVKRPGFYSIKAMSQPGSISAGELQSLNLYKNGAFFRTLMQSRNNAGSADDTPVSGAYGTYLNVGDYIDVRHQKSNTTTSTASANLNWIAIEQVK